MRPLFLIVLNNELQLILANTLLNKLIVYEIKDWFPIMDEMMLLTKPREVIDLTMVITVSRIALLSIPYASSKTESE